VNEVLSKGPYRVHTCSFYWKIKQDSYTADTHVLSGKWATSEGSYPIIINSCFHIQLTLHEWH